VRTISRTPFHPTACAIALMSLFGASQAQQAAAPAGTAPAASSSSGEIQVIEVTSQKRRESVLKTPVAVTALSAGDLDDAGVKGTADLVNLVPNVQIGTANNGNTNISIRGIGSTNTTELGDPAAAFHIDGVYLGRPRSAQGTFFDLERVEVLRGPQGTLYGRNATAGAINIITNKPSFGRLGGELQFEFGNYNTLRAEGSINAPLNDVVAVRAALLSVRQDNYVETAVPDNKRRTEAGRVQALAKLSPNVSLLVSADHARFSGPDIAGVVAPLQAERGSAGRVNLNVLGGDNVQVDDGVSAELNWNLGAATLTYIGAHRSSKSDNHDDINLGFLVEHRGGLLDAKQNSHELRLTSNDTQPLKWVAGLYYFNEAQTTDAFFAGGLLTFKFPHIYGKSQAVFGQATYSLKPELRLTLGLRNTHDEKENLGGVSTNAFPTLGGGPLFVGNTNFQKSWSKTNYRAGIEYDLDKNSMVYASVATAYKAGGFNNAEATPPGAPTVPASPYNPENLTSVEAGWKTRLQDGRAQLSVAAFHYDYKDLQVLNIVDFGNGNVVNSITNAGKASVTGLEVEYKQRVGAMGRLDTFVGLTNAKYDRYDSCVNEVTGASQVCTGNQLRNAPKVQFGVAYEHAIALGDAQLKLRASTRYSSKFYNDDTNSATFEQKAYTRTDLSARYEAASDRWWLGAYARNLEDRNVKTSRYPAVVAGQAYTYIGYPRTVGVQGGLRF
jgi:iron complex outermembrane recepter protein